MPLEDLILRLHPRPIDMPAQMLVLNRSTTLAQWDVFLERLGTPPAFSNCRLTAATSCAIFI